MVGGVDVVELGANDDKSREKAFKKTWGRCVPYILTARNFRMPDWAGMSGRGATSAHLAEHSPMRSQSAWGTGSAQTAKIGGAPEQITRP